MVINNYHCDHHGPPTRPANAVHENHPQPYGTPPDLHPAIDALIGRYETDPITARRIARVIMTLLDND